MPDVAANAFPIVFGDLCWLPHHGPYRPVYPARPFHALRHRQVKFTARKRVAATCPPDRFVQAEGRGQKP